jgi:hypothetical protein
MVSWFYAMASMFYTFNEKQFLSLAFLSFWVLQLTKWDVRFISKNIENWQFRALLFTIYAFLWGMALYKYYVIGGFEKGLVFMFDSLTISPFSEGLLAIFVNFPLGQVESFGQTGKKISDVYFSYLSTPVSIIASFMLLELLVRFLKNVLTRTEKFAVQQNRCQLVCVQLFLLVGFCTLWYCVFGTVTIVITNNSGKTVHSVEMTYNDGAQSVGPLQNGERNVSKISVATNTNLKVSLHSNISVVKNCLIGIRLDQYDDYKVEIFLDKNFVVTAISDEVIYDCKFNSE